MNLENNNEKIYTYKFVNQNIQKFLCLQLKIIFINKNNKIIIYLQ